MTDQHPITPPSELVKQWSDIGAMENAVIQNWVKIATAAAQWGADQELKACCEWLNKSPYGASLAVNGVIEQLRAARRPKPPSLKEQALRILVENGTTLDGRIELEPEDIPVIRRALEQLND